MTGSFDQGLLAIYTDYKQKLKPLIAEIESLDQQFPTAVLNEIRACFDHIARCYPAVDARTTAREIEQAQRHMRRAVLDCYKILIVFFHDDIKGFLNRNKNKDWSTVDGGRFHANFQEKVLSAQSRYQEAKSQPDDENRLENTCQTYREIYIFLREPRNVTLVDEGKDKSGCLNKLFWCVLSAILGVIIGWCIG